MENKSCRNGSKMKRSKAIEKLAISQLKKLSEEERAEQLEIMTLEDWSENKGWNYLPQEIKLNYKKVNQLKIRILINTIKYC